MNDDTITRLNAAMNTTIADHLRIIADAYCDAGDEDMASAFRWLADEQKEPMRYAEKWYWHLIGAEFYCSTLPNVVTTTMYGMKVDQLGLSWNESPSKDGAYYRAAVAIVASRKAKPVSARRDCPDCRGSGREIIDSVYGHSPEYGPCDRCGGQGWVEPEPATRACPDCDGTGQEEVEERGGFGICSCVMCQGTGKVTA